MHLLACAAVTRIAGRLRLAFRAVGRAVETDMEVGSAPRGARQGLTHWTPLMR
jgi:hypothetical protein